MKYICSLTAIVYQFTFSADSTTVDSIICATGQQDTWKFYKFQMTQDGGYFCIFSCSADGAGFNDFICSATDASYFDEETQVVSTVTQIPNSENIYNAYSNCPPPENCVIFN